MTLNPLSFAIKTRVFTRVGELFTLNFGKISVNLQNVLTNHNK